MKELGITWYEHLTIPPVVKYSLVEFIDENGARSIRCVPVEERAVSIVIDQFPGHKFPGILYTVLADFEVPLKDVIGFGIANMLETGSKIQDGYKTIIKMQDEQAVYYSMFIINKKIFGSKSFILLGTPALAIAVAIEASLPHISN